MRKLLSRTPVAGVLAVTMVLAFVATTDAQLSTRTNNTFLRRTTLGYRNATSAMIVQTVPEIGISEKEVEIGDFDNDGDPDVLMAVARSDFTSRRNKLFRNDNNVYQEISGTTAIPYFSGLDVSRNGFFRDYDADGWLDIIILNDANNGNPDGITRFYSNKHPGGVFSHFVDETSRLGGAGGAACGGISADLDNDGDMDFYMGNYPFNSQDTMYFNNGAGVFTNVTANNVPAEQDYTVDIGVGDINGDGKKDLLVVSMFDPSYIYYNDLPGGGSSGVGDFKYTNGQTAFPALSVEGAMEAADFNGDGKLDIYYSNRSGFQDWILQNTGNASGKAVFTTSTAPGPVSASESRKATVGDLNRDGRPDLVVMGENRRPHILRNTSVNGQISFVDWTPASEFVNGGTYAGWHAATFDANSDGRLDILVGGMNNDHMFVYESPPEFKEATLGGVLPAFYNSKPVTILGNASNGETDVYAANGVATNADVSIVLRTLSGDVVLRVKNSAGNVIASSDRGGTAIEEALMFDAPSGGFTVEVSMMTKKGPTAYVLELLGRN